MTDTERLDWLEIHSITAVRNGTWELWPFYDEGNPLAEGVTLRDAIDTAVQVIDAAMQAEQRTQAHGAAFAREALRRLRDADGPRETGGV